jgi:hypothetical protein
MSAALKAEKRKEAGNSRLNMSTWISQRIELNPDRSGYYRE